eukprot:Hpha_TRINITY_DN15479_c5_g9::TRINITY_DN15479_c5_g9_i1::g.173295::m.173295
MWGWTRLSNDEADGAQGAGDVALVAHGLEHTVAGGALVGHLLLGLGGASGSSCVLGRARARAPRGGGLRGRWLLDLTHLLCRLLDLTHLLGLLSRRRLLLALCRSVLPRPRLQLKPGLAHGAVELPARRIALHDTQSVALRARHLVGGSLLGPVSRGLLLLRLRLGLGRLLEFDALLLARLLLLLHLGKRGHLGHAEHLLGLLHDKLTLGRREHHRLSRGADHLLSRHEHELGLRRRDHTAGTGHNEPSLATALGNTAHRHTRRNLHHLRLLLKHETALHLTWLKHILHLTRRGALGTSLGRVEQELLTSSRVCDLLGDSARHVLNCLNC